MIKRESSVAITPMIGAKLTEKQISQLTNIYCRLSGVTIEDVTTALETVKITLLIRGGNTKFAVPESHDFTYNEQNPKDSAKYDGEICSVGVTLQSTLDNTRIFKCGLKDAINFALLLP